MKRGEIVLKNLVFVGSATLALAAASIASAQSSSVIDQDGASHQATVDQIGDGNRSVIRQGDVSVPVPNVFAGTVTSGSNSNATNLQDGSNLSSTIVQGAEAQTAFVDQVGGGHVSIIGQGLLGAAGTGNDANITQSATGTLNRSIVYQGSNANTARVVQTGDSANNSYIDQGYVGGTEFGGDNNSAEVEQNGSSNVSTVFQSFGTAGSFNEAIVFQVGTSNNSSIGQYGSDNSAMVTQRDGASHISSIAQGSSNNSAIVLQRDGTGNFSDVNQGSVSGTGIGGDDSVANVEQVGSANRSNVIQTPIAAGSGNMSDIFQSGTGNIQTVFQGAIGNITNLVQTGGSGNTSYIDQGYVNQAETDGDNNRADLEQDGSNNSNSILQNFNLTGSDNEADVLQVGIGNNSSVNQNGSFNIAGVSQYDGSVSQLTQTGDGNMATVTQGSAPIP